MKNNLRRDNVQLQMIHTDKFKSDFLSISFIVPLEERTAALNSLMLKILKRGTVHYPDMRALSKKLDFLYSADIFTKATCFGEAQVISFSIDMLNNAYALDDVDILEESARVLCEIIFSPRTENGMFVSEYFESEKKNQLDEIDASINNKAGYALSRLCTHMFAKERYAAAQSLARKLVEGLSNAEVYAHYQNFLKSAKPEVMFVGNADQDKVDRVVSEIFSGRAYGAGAPVSTEVIRRAATPKEIVESCKATQGNLVIGFRTGTVLSDGNYPVFALFNELYGGSPSSRLFMNVREKKSLCYFCVSVPEATKGAMFVRAGIENKNFEVARDAIFAELSAVQNGKFTADELSMAKLSLINAYREIADNPQALQNWYLARALSGINESPEEVIARIEKITADEIVEIANKVTPDTVYFLKGDGKQDGQR